MESGDEHDGKERSGNGSLTLSGLVLTRDDEGRKNSSYVMSKSKSVLFVNFFN